MFRRLYEDFKAWRRGEHRVAPGMRGRVYERKHVVEEDSPAWGVHTSGHKAKVQLKAKVTRANGSIEDYIISVGKAKRV